MSGFSFGTPTSQVGTKPTLPSFGSFGTTQTPSNTGAPSTAFGFASPATGTVTMASSGFSFGSPVTSSLGAPGATTAPQTAFGLSGFGNLSANQPPTLFSTSTSNVSTTTSAPSFGAAVSYPFGSLAPITTSSTAGSFGFGLTSKPTTTTATVPTGLSFGTPVTSAASTTASSGFSFGVSSTQPSTTTVAPFTVPITSTAQTTSAGLNVNSATTCTSTGALTFGVQKTGVASSSATSTTTAFSAFSLGGLVKSTDTTTTASTVTTTTVVTTSAPTSTGSVAQPLPTSFTYRQLEEIVNKWTYELDEQSRNFASELSRLNKADGVLIANADKISDLHSKVEACKAGQTRIEQELEFVESQQRTLEDLLEPLEQAAADLPPSQQHADAEREAIFQMCINTDLELGQLLSELRDMAERVNAVTADLEPGMDASSGLTSTTVSNSGGDGGGIEKTNNVIGQVTRILNSHMHSLSWLSQNTQELMEKMKFLSTA